MDPKDAVSLRRIQLRVDCPAQLLARYAGAQASAVSGACRSLTFGDSLCGVERAVAASTPLQCVQLFVHFQHMAGVKLAINVA
jgi:hypothetical protein